MSATEILLVLLVAGLGILLWLNQREFRKLRRWAAEPNASAPEAEGEWGEVFNDLNRYRRANILNRRQLARLMIRSRRGAEALPYGVTVLNAEMRIDWCNAAASEHLGIALGKDRGQPIANYVRSPEFVEYLGEKEFSHPVRIPSPGEPDRRLDLQLVPFGDDENLLLSNDVTGAERLESMRRDFVANVSHELRTPLTVLAGFLETIQDLKLDPQRVRDYVGLMAPQAERMKRLTEDLLTLSSLEHATAPPPQQRVAIRPLLERVRTETVALSRGRHKVTLTLAADFDVLGSESELASAFLNLASNAVRYTPAGGEVRIIWRRAAEGAEYAVEDTGIGISPEHLPRLTERFYRVDRSRSRETGGTGLGLSIVKHALARHQATLIVESKPGKGSAFIARFPAARLEPALQKVMGPAAMPE